MPTLPIKLGGLIRLKLRQLPLQIYVNFFCFFKRKTKIIETCLIDTSFNVGSFATVSNR